MFLGGSKTFFWDCWILSSHVVNFISKRLHESHSHVFRLRWPYTKLLNLWEFNLDGWVPPCQILWGHRSQYISWQPSFNFREGLTMVSFQRGSHRNINIRSFLTIQWNCGIENGTGKHGCQMAISRFLDCMCLALRASGLWLRSASLQNLIPSFPWIASSTLAQSKEKEGIKFCHLATSITGVFGYAFWCG